MFTLRAGYEMGSGNTDAAAADILTLFHLARKAGKQGALIDFLISCALEKHAEISLRELLWECELTAEQLAALDRELRALPPRPDFRNALRGELFFYYDIIQRWMAGEAEEEEEWFFFESCGIDENIFRRRTHQLLAPILQAIDEPDPLRRFRIVEQKCETSLDSYGTPEMRLKTVLNMLTVQTRSRDMADTHFSLIMCSYIQAAQADVRAEVCWKMSLLAVALERYRVEHGTYPEDLKELAEEYWPTGSESVSLDPWTGQETLHYARNPQTSEAWRADCEARKAEFLAQRKEWDLAVYQDPAYPPDTEPYYRPYILYSFGPNGIDDHGQASDNTGNDCDEIW